MLAAKKGHEDVVLVFTQKEANLNLVNRVSVYIYGSSFSLKKVLIMIVL